MLGSPLLSLGADTYLFSRCLDAGTGWPGPHSSTVMCVCVCVCVCVFFLQRRIAPAWLVPVCGCPDIDEIPAWLLEARAVMSVVCWTRFFPAVVTGIFSGLGCQHSIVDSIVEQASLF